MIDLVLVFVQMAFASALLWSCFCRMVRTDDDTIREVRWAIWLESIAAMLVLGAPLLPALAPGHVDWPAGSTPLWIWLALLVAATLVQIVTARHWKHGVPLSFTNRWQETAHDHL